MKIFREIASSLNSQWKTQNYDNRVFPRLAAAALESFDLPGAVAATDILGWSVEQEALPLQANLESSFGQPPITLFRDDRMYLDAIFWRRATTTIHQHGFSGAFQVLSGTCVHAEYDFTTGHRVGLALAFGDLRLKSLGILNVGDVRPILLGDQFIHASYHVESPTVTVVIRTVSEPWLTPQYNYLPGVAYSPFQNNQTRTRRLQCLNLIKDKYFERFPDAARRMVQSDLVTAFHALQVAFDTGHPGVFEEAYQHARQVHGEVIASLPEAFAHERRMQDMVKRRGNGDDPDLNFFIGALAYGRSRAEVAQLIASRYPDRSLAEVEVELAARMLKPWTSSKSEPVRRLTARALTLLVGERRSTAVTAEVLAQEFALGSQEGQLLAGFLQQFGDSSLLRPLLA